MLPRVIQLAAKEGSVSTYDLLMEHCKLPTRSIPLNRLSKCLREASKYGHLNFIKRMLSQHMQPGKYINCECVSTAIEEGHTEIAEYLLKEGSFRDLNEPLVVASQHGHLNLVDYCLRHDGTDVNKTAALRVAADKNQFKIVQRLLQEEHIDVNDRRDRYGTPLTYAAMCGNVGIVDCLLKHRATEVNRGHPLLYAVSYGNNDIVERLLQHKDIDVNICGYTPAQYGAVFCRDRTALVIAAERGNLRIVERLLAHPKIEVHRGDPVLKAVVRGHRVIARRLLQKIDIGASMLEWRQLEDKVVLKPSGSFHH